MGYELAEQRARDNAPGRGQQGGQSPAAKRKQAASRDVGIHGWSGERVGGLGWV